MTGLAEAGFLPPPTLPKPVDQLVDQNLVHRRVDPVDRRRVLAHLTAPGQEYRQRVDRAVRAGLPPSATATTSCCGPCRTGWRRRRRTPPAWDAPDPGPAAR